MNARLEAWTGLRLEDPLLLLLGGVVLLALLIRALRGGPALLFAPPTDALPRTWRVRFHRAPIGLEALALLLLVVAAARPVHRSPLPLRSEGIDIVLCLDVSSSMKGTDMDAARTRLEVAKDEARAFIARRESDRIGLVRFARFADVVGPLTSDHEALATLLDDVEPVTEDGPEDRTGIGTALLAAARLLEAAGHTSRVVLLLTDGEENVATAETPDEIGPLPAAQLLAGRGVRVYPIVVGVGRPGPRGTWEPLDLDQVTKVAERTGGALLLARDAAAMGEVYRTIDRLEKAPFEAPRFVIEERFPGFVAAAIGLGLLALLLRRTLFEVVP